MAKAKTGVHDAPQRAGASSARGNGKEESEDPKESLKENIIAVTLILILVLAVGWWVYNRITYMPQESDVRADIAVGGSPALGNESAPVTVVIFSDFECTFCRDFALQEFSGIKAAYVDTGKARFVFKHFPLRIHPDASKAAEAAVCAQEQDRFWEYHDLLFENQGALKQDDLVRYAQEAGLNMTEFRSCLETGRNRDVQQDVRQGEEAGVSGTPTFFFNGRKVVGALSVEEFGSQIDKS